MAEGLFSAIRKASAQAPTELHLCKTFKFSFDSVLRTIGWVDVGASG
jgi:hypothetical protein